MTAPADGKQMANAIRALAMDAVQAANSGHPGMPMGMADVATVLFGSVMNYDPSWPQWPDRDRFVLSAGHGSMLLYACLHLAGYARPTMDDIRAFRQLHSPCAGHPEYGELPGIETTTGPLGQGLATAVGMAMAERHLNARFGDDLVNHHTYVIAGDGCLMEGISHEAIGLAGHLKLGRLIVLWDDNGISIDGPISLSSSENTLMRFDAAGWQTLAVDGHDQPAIAAALAAAKGDSRPTLIACKTVIGFGAPTLAGTSKTHGSPLGAAEIAGAREKLGWTAEPFVIPGPIADAWAAAGARGKSVAAAWKARHSASSSRAAFDAAHDAQAVATLANAAVADHINQLLAKPQTIATRKASEIALEAINVAVTNTVGGSADLTGSNNTKTKGQEALTASNYGGRYVYYGIREFGMAAAMNGMALHGGIVPYGGTFLVFTDYCRPAIRLSALQHQRVIYVMTHDSIGLGEDGPTHQPVEHLAALRAMPNVLVMRPADAVETAECWAIAMANTSGPSVLALSRQNLAQVRLQASSRNLSALGAYTLRAADGTERVTLIATGSEVQLALDVQAELASLCIAASVASMPSWELFEKQDDAYQRQVMPKGTLKVALEAGIGQGWERYTGRRGLFIGMSGFGLSAPAEDLFNHFGLTTKAVVARIQAAL
jgi:transketolase